MSADVTIKIVGDGGHVGQVIALAKAANPRKILLATNMTGANFGRRVQIFPMDEHSQKIRADITVGAFTRSDNSFSYTSDVAEKIFGKHIKHPSVLNDFITTDLTGNFIAGGFPGSGNAVIAVTAEHLLEHTKPNQRGGQIRIFQNAYEGNHHTQILEALEDLKGEIGARTVSLATYTNTITHCNLVGENSSTWFVGLPTRGWLRERVHRTHEFFSAKYQHMLHAGALGILAVRHPLDIFISNAKKLSLLGFDVVGSDEATYEIASGIVRFYESFGQSRSMNILPLRYEDMRHNFVNTARRLANHIGVDADDNLLRSLEGKIIDQPIAHEGHLQLQPPGKWRQHLSRQQAHLLEKSGLLSLISELGYGTTTITDFSRDASPFQVDAYDPLKIPLIYGTLTQRLDTWSVHLLRGHSTLRTKNFGTRFMLAASDEVTLNSTANALADGAIGRISQAGFEVPLWDKLNA